MSSEAKTSTPRERRRRRIRTRITGIATRPRLAVFRSNRYISAQLIDDERGHTIAAVSSQYDAKDGKKPAEQARSLGRLLAQKAKEAKITAVVFDRGGYDYSGKIRDFAEGAREGGLLF